MPLTPTPFGSGTPAHTGSAGTGVWSGGWGGRITWGEGPSVSNSGWGGRGRGLLNTASTVYWGLGTESIVSDRLLPMRSALPLSQNHPLVATEDDVYCAVTIEDNRLDVYRRFTSGWALHFSLASTDTTTPMTSAALATDGTTCVVVWTNDVDTTHVTTAIWACLFDETGHIGSPFQVSLVDETYCGLPSVCFDEYGAPIFAYQANSPDSTLLQIQLVRGTLAGSTWTFVRRTVSGQLVGVTDDEYPARYPSVGAATGTVVVAYKYEGNPSFQRTVAVACMVNPLVASSRAFEPIDAAQPEVVLAGEVAESTFDPIAGLPAHDPCIGVTSSGQYVVGFHRPDGTSNTSYRHVWYCSSTDGATWQPPVMIADTPPATYYQTQFVNLAMTPVGSQVGVVVWECNDSAVRSAGNMRIHGAVFEGDTPPTATIMSDGDASAEDQVDRTVATYASWPFVYVGPNQVVHLVWLGCDDQSDTAAATLYYRRGNLG